MNRWWGHGWGDQVDALKMLNVRMAPNHMKLCLEPDGCGECPHGEGASGCGGDCIWNTSLGECTEDNGVDSVVSCGNYNAADCSQCDVSEDGSSGRIGECKFADGECRSFEWEPPVDVCRISAGLRASYFSAESLPTAGLLDTYTPYKIDTVSSINFDNGKGSVATSGKSDKVAATFEGSLLFEVTGTHHLCLRHDDGAKLFVDGKKLFDVSSAKENCASVSVTGGNLKKILVEYLEHTGDAHCQLKWTKPGSITKVIIPASAWVEESYRA